MKYTFEMILLGVGAFLALVGAGFAQDRHFEAHMWVLFFTLLAGTILLMRRIEFSPASAAGRHRRHPSRSILTRWSSTA
jgi:cytochrome c oxidase cbb3-type subunit I